jgi:hypothetical protein
MTPTVDHPYVPMASQPPAQLQAGRAHNKNIETINTRELYNAQAKHPTVKYLTDIHRSGFCFKNRITLSTKALPYKNFIIKCLYFK